MHQLQFQVLTNKKALLQYLDKLTTHQTSKMIPPQHYYYPFYQYPWYSYQPLPDQWENVQAISTYKFEPSKDLPQQNKKIMKTQQVMISQDNMLAPSKDLTIPSIPSKPENILVNNRILKQSCNSSKPKKNKRKQVQHDHKEKPEYDKEGRNANSNLLRMFFRNLEQIIEADPSLVNEIIAKQKLKITFAKFQEWFEINKAQHRNYIRLPTIKRLFVCTKNNKQQTKIMRILLQDFINNQAHLFYLTSKKVKKAAMRYNFKSFRNIIFDIFETSE